jgi:hypothetical protein
MLPLFGRKMVVANQMPEKSYKSTVKNLLFYG